MKPDEEEVCLGCNRPTALRDCGCPAGTGIRKKAGRRLTVEEARDEFLKHIWSRVEDLSSTDERVLPQPQSIRQRLHKLAFGILVAIDGEAVEFPGFDLVPRVPKEDQDYLKSEGRNWFPDGEDISLGSLHDRFYDVGREIGKLKE